MNYLFNATKKHTVSWWSLLIIALLFLILFYILFPKQTLINQLMTEQVPSQISLSYLQRMIVKNPNDLDLKISLAKQEIFLGELQQANNLIMPYVTWQPTTDLQWQILSLYYQIVRIEAFALQKDDPLRRRKEELLTHLLPILERSPTLTIAEGKMFIMDSLSFDNPQLAILFYKKSLNFSWQKSRYFYATAGLVALFINDYQDSAKFYLLAMQESNTLVDQRKYYFKAVNSLKLSGNAKLALNFALKHLGDLKADQKTQIMLATLATEADNIEVADYFIQKLLQLRYLE